MNGLARPVWIGVVRYVVVLLSGIIAGGRAVDAVQAWQEAVGRMLRPWRLRRRYLTAMWLVFLVALLPACRPRDSGFAALQRRGAAAMGVDQYTSSHVFEALPDGGRIVLQRQTDDSAGTATIRAHLSTIAAQFRRGDFAVPGFVHAQGVPGTDVMTSHRTRISYRADTLPRGGQVRITTTDPAALTAIHEFLAFQRREHHAAGHGK